MGGRVVVGTDGSPGGRAALVEALAAAARRRCGLDVLSAYPVDYYWTDAWLVDRARLDLVRARTVDRAREQVDRARGDEALAGVPGVPEVPVDLLPVGGPPAERLIERAGAEDLLVVGSRGRGAVRGALLGSVSLRCVMHARSPVVVVHPDRPGRPGGGGAVVVGLDGSAASRAALAAAVPEARRRGAAVEVVTALEPVEHWPDLGAVAGTAAGGARGAAVRAARATVAEVLAGVPGGTGPGAPEVRCDAVEGRPAAVLVERAAGAGLLVVGNRGHGTLPGLLLGSVALRCVVHAPCPVMVVHPAPERAAPDDRLGPLAARA